MQFRVEDFAHRLLGDNPVGAQRVQKGIPDGDKIAPKPVTSRRCAALIPIGKGQIQMIGQWEHIPQHSQTLLVGFADQALLQAGAVAVGLDAQLGQFILAAGRLGQGIVPFLGQPVDLDLGTPFDLTGLLVPDLPAPAVRPGELAAPIVAIDPFGNLELLAGPADLEAAGFTMGDRISAAVTDRRHPATVCRVFADAAPKGMLVHIDSHGMVALAVNGGSAAQRMGAAAGQILTLGRWTSP